MDLTLWYRSNIVARVLAPFISPDKKILDIGCGNGFVTHVLEKKFNCKIVGTDILSYLTVPLEFKLMPKEDVLDFKNSQFDTGLFITVLHHVSSDNQIEIIKEALRVCREVLIFETKPSFLAKLIDIILAPSEESEMSVPLTHRTAEQWIKLFKDNGIMYEFVKVKNILYPVTNYLFRLKQ